MSGVDLDGVSIRKGAVDAVLAYARQQPSATPVTREINAIAEKIAKAGGTPLGRCRRTAGCSASST